MGLGRPSLLTISVNMTEYNTRKGYLSIGLTKLLTILVTPLKSNTTLLYNLHKAVMK